MCLATLEKELEQANVALENVAVMLRRNGLGKKKLQAVWEEWQECVNLIEQLKRDIKWLQRS